MFSPESQQWGTGCVSKISGWTAWVSKILTAWPYLTTLRKSCKNVNGVFVSELFFLLYLFCVPNSTHFCTLLKTRRTGPTRFTFCIFKLDCFMKPKFAPCSRVIKKKIWTLMNFKLFLTMYYDTWLHAEKTALTRSSEQPLILK